MRKHTTKQIIEADIDLSISMHPARNKNFLFLPTKHKIDTYKEWLTEEWISYTELIDWIKKRYTNMDNIQLILDDLTKINKFKSKKTIRG